MMTLFDASDPPYFTACPNPFLRDYAANHTAVSVSPHEYDQSPFISDLTEGKGGKIYRRTPITPKFLTKLSLD